MDIIITIIIVVVLKKTLWSAYYNRNTSATQA